MKREKVSFLQKEPLLCITDMRWLREIITNGAKLAEYGGIYFPLNSIRIKALIQGTSCNHCKTPVKAVLVYQKTPTTTYALVVGGIDRRTRKPIPFRERVIDVYGSHSDPHNHELLCEKCYILAERACNYQEPVQMGRNWHRVLSVTNQEPTGYGSPVLLTFHQHQTAA